MAQFTFVVPRNDVESVAIVELLKRNGYEEGKDLFVTSQGWGASWAGLEPDIKKAIRSAGRRFRWSQVRYMQGYPAGVETREGACPPSGATEVEELVPDFSHIYGVELQGQTLCNNIDHHIYDGDDRHNDLSSLEQVAQLLGVTLSVEEAFIAANDKGYIPAMKQLGEELFMEETEVNAMIEKVRALDRSAQGITADQEEQAEQALQNAETCGSLTVVRLPHSKCATITDRLFGQYENLLVLCGDGEANFYGKGELCRSLLANFEGWAGGDLNTSGFWGGYPNQRDVEKFVREALA
jgi:hypothetical protein